MAEPLTQVSRTAVAGLTGEVVLKGSHLIGVSPNPDVISVDVSDPLLPLKKSTLALGGENRRIRLEPDSSHAWVSGRNTDVLGIRLAAVDLSALPALSVAGAITFGPFTTGHAFEFKADGSYAVGGVDQALGASDHGWAHYTTANPAAPGGAYTASADFDGASTGVSNVVRVGTHVYVASYGAKKITVFDVSGAAPVIVGSLTVVYLPLGLLGHGSQLLVGNETNGRIERYDISTPSAPAFVESIVGNLHMTCMVGSMGFNHSGSITVWDLAAVPAVPLYVGTPVLSHGIAGIAANDRFIYSNGSGGAVGPELIVWEWPGPPPAAGGWPGGPEPQWSVGQLNVR